MICTAHLTMRIDAEAFTLYPKPFTHRRAALLPSASRLCKLPSCPRSNYISVTQPHGNPVFTSEREKHHHPVPFLPAIQWPCSLPGLHSLLESSLRLTRLIRCTAPKHSRYPSTLLLPLGCDTPPHSAH